MSTTNNEVARVVVNFHSFAAALAAADLHTFGQEDRLFLVCDATPAGVSWSRIAMVGWEYSQIDALCGKRAIAAEFGRLLVDGRAVTAEKYLAIWREAAARHLPIESLLERGLQVHRLFVLPTTTCTKEANAAHWYASARLLRRDDHTSVWNVPLTNLDDLRLASALSRVYWSPDEVAGQHFGKWDGVTTDPDYDHGTAAATPRDLLSEAA